MKCKAFTLIELLVVISIVIILIAIVIPVLGTARQYARTTRCSSNIRQLTMSLKSYELKNETFPYSFFYSESKGIPSGGHLGNLAYDYAGWWWINYIFDFSKRDIGKGSVFWCPSRKIKSNLFKADVLVGNYGVNQSICKRNIVNDEKDEFTGSSLSSIDIRSPASTVLIVDSGYATINWNNVTNSPPETLNIGMEDYSYLPGLAMNKNRKLWEDQKDDAENGRHMNKKVNIGFVDGHVSM